MSFSRKYQDKDKFDKKMDRSKKFVKTEKACIYNKHQDCIDCQCCDKE